MEVHIEPVPMMRQVKVWFYSALPDKVVILHFDGQPDEEVPIDGNPGEPSFILPERAFRLLLDKAQGVLPVDETTSDALKDTRKVRDRLLTLVERLAE